MRRKLRAGVLAAAVGALVLPPTAAMAHPGHDHEAPVVAADPTDPTDWANYERVLLAKDVGEPIGLSVLPDLTVLHTARDGVIRHTDPSTGATTQIADIDVYNNSEDGLQSLALDPDFEENGWIYLFYAPRVMSNDEGENYPETTPEGSAPTSLPEGEDDSYWDIWRGYNQLTRVQWDFEARTLDLDNEEVILKVEAQRGQCCHVGGDIDFDLDGNLLLGTGDNTPASAPGANGFAPNNDAPGMNPGVDARRGAGNTNDLRGAILRIAVNDDASYSIPEGNLFPVGTEGTRPEIYVGGLRNPFRMAVDPASGALTWADYGPDSGVASDERGPMGYVEWQSTTVAMNGGWPYCHGPNANYNEWDFENSAPREFFDCEAGAVNNSRWNTGLETLPPATAPQLYYGDNPGDQPFDELVEFSPNGGQGPMGGPVFRYDETIENPGQLPEYWDGKAFMYEFSQDYVAAISLEGLGTDEGVDWDGAVTEIENFMPNEALETNNQPTWSGPIDMEIGPDGAMYVLDYGKGFFRQNPEAGLYRVEWAPENKSPVAIATADPASSATAPVTVTFDGSQSYDPEGEELTYEWDFDRDGTFDAEGVSAQETFEQVGTYAVTLRVTDPQGKSTATSTVVTVGNEAPELTLNYPADGGFFSWGDAVPYRYTATDAEDGDEIVCENLSWTFGLGHDTHAHPLESRTQTCEGTMNTPADAVEHGETEKLYGVIVATYFDNGTDEVDPARTEVSTVLNVRDQQAEHSNTIAGAERVADQSAQAFQKVVFGEGGQLSYTPVNFVGIDGVTARAQGEGTVELRWGAADAEPFATASIASDGWADVAFTGADGGAVAFPEGTGELFVTGSAGLELDSWLVDGDGVTQIPAGEEPDPIHIPVEQVSMGMYSLGPWTEEVGLEPVLERLAEIGYENVEPYGANLEPYEASEFREITDDLGLSVLTSHYNTDETTFDETLEYVSTLGQQWVGSGGFAAPGLDTLPDTLATAETMNRLGAASVEAEVGKFFGHNHASEFTTVFPAGDHADEELSAWEILAQNTDEDLVTFQLDVAWATHAGVDVVDLLDEYGDRIELLHIKDATNLGAATGPSFVNLGEGDVPLQAILAKAQEVGVELYTLEYDRTPDGESFATEGFEYITGLPAGGDDGDGENVQIPVEQVSMGMFSLNNWVNQDGIVPVMDRLSTIGFENIEPFSRTFAGLSAQETRALADSYGIAIPSAHNGGAEVTEAQFPQTLERATVLGQRYVGSGGFAAPGFGSYEDVLATAETMDRLGAASVANGTGKFFGHNHAVEFATMFEHEGETRSAWEILVMETDPELVTFQVDVAWAEHADVDVVELLAEHGERIDLLHIKDATGVGGYDPETNPRPTFVNLGEGEVPLQEILAEAVEQDVDLFVMEYDGSPANDVFAAEGFEYLTGVEAGDPTPVPFVDVPIGMQFFSDISWLFDNGISTGWETEAGREFRPVTPIARDAMAAFLYRQSNSPEFTAPTTSPFTDVSTDNQFYKEIAWLHAEGISTGWDNGDGTFSFRPLEPINRDAMAAFLYRMADSPEFTGPAVSPFTDITPETQYYDEITWLVAEGISTGWLGNDGTAIYRPVNPINRDAMAAFLHRYDDAGFSNVGGNTDS
ncbi:PQQ-dependent sugar dehydrogenase [Litorihabitans aurantiacus]|nr:PQQ-dependent sugar dehydrogenase [Litorihabitans aurantiacus]